MTQTALFNQPSTPQFGQTNRVVPAGTRAPTMSQRTSTAFLEVKKHQVFSATTEQNIARVNLFRKPSVSSHLMAIVALVNISSSHLL